jgi:hypothetical protein
MLRVLGLIKTPLLKIFVDCSYGNFFFNKKVVFIAVLHSPLLAGNEKGCLMKNLWKFRAFKTKDKTPIYEKGFCNLRFGKRE